MGSKTILPTPQHPRRSKSNSYSFEYTAGHRIIGANSYSESSSTSNAGLDETDDNMVDDKVLYKNKKYEIEHRDNPITEFGKKSGVDIDEIALMLQGTEDIDDLWFKLTNNKSVITKKTEIYKLLYALTEMTLKEGAKNKKPPTNLIKSLMSLIWKKLPKKNGKCSLELTMFITQFHRILYQIHDEVLLNEKDKIIEP